MSTNLYVLLIMGLLELSLAQRPSFAGSRPPGGLTQTDKYHGTQNTALENITGVDIGTRFGEDTVTQQTQSVNLAFGTPQRPPVGVPLVYPINGYVPVAVPQQPAAAPFAPVSTTISLDNRFGGNDNNVNRPVNPNNVGRPIPSSGVSANANSNGSFSPSGSSGPTFNRPISNALPIDAHGDQEYVNYLSQLPEDSKPFWFLNYQAIEALRNSTRPNVAALENRGSTFAG